MSARLTMHSVLNRARHRTGPARLLLLACGALPISGGLYAQGVESVSRAQGGNAPSWTRAWSPLVSLAELPRSLPGDGIPMPSLLTLPAPRVGLFWTAGTPGALPSEVQDERAEFRLGIADASGAYRRPLDVGAASHEIASSYAWGALGGRGAGIGRVVVDRRAFDEGVFANVLHPYATEPYAVLDTLGEATSGTTVVLEGAGGWRLGRLGMGIGLGYATQDMRTVESAVPRIHTIATPGLTAGVNIDVLQGRLQVGVFARWQQTAETVRAYSVAAASRFYLLQGYNDPVAINLSGTHFSRRFERDAWAAGGAAAGALGPVSWVVFAQRERRSAANFNITTIDSPRDLWDADGWTAGMAAQSPVAQGRALVTLEARYTELSGAATHHGIEDTPFSAEEDRLDLSGEFRLRLGARWEAASHLCLRTEHRNRSDYLAETYSDLRSWQPSGAVEVAGWILPTVAVAVGGAVAEHNPSGAIPLSTGMGPVYRNWVAPEVELEATEAHVRAGAVTLLWQARTTTAFWLQARHQSVSPAARGAGSLPNQPVGERTGWTATVGLVLGAR